MPDLSPAQKAVAAFNERHELCGPFDDDWVEQGLAAALEAVADQVVPEHKPWHRTGEREAARHDVRLELLAIAAELRGTTINQEDN
jgi:hypothetical protein